MCVSLLKSIACRGSTSRLYEGRPLVPSLTCAYTYKDDYEIATLSSGLLSHAGGKNAVTKTILLGIVALGVIGGVFLLRPTRTADAPAPAAALPFTSFSSMPRPPANIQPISRTVHVTFKTSHGNIEADLFGADAPVTVGNFVALAQDHFFDDTQFHRVIPGFMIQGGDPLSKDPTLRARHGTGGPGYTFPDEINARMIVRGTVAMANAGPDTNGSQFFIVTAEATPHLDGKHTNFGTVTSGLEVVEAISQVPRDESDHPRDPVVIEEALVSDPPGAGP